jgi:DNA-binding NarL/FixJ family response regulator
MDKSLRSGPEAKSVETVDTMSQSPAEAKSTIQVLLADDHALVREGTRRLLEAEPDIRVVAEANDGYETVREAERTHPDVAIIDVAMPNMSGIEATRRVKSLLPNIAVLALTAYDDDQYILALLDAGAAGFMLKDVRGHDLVEAVRAVSRGESVLQPQVGGCASIPLPPPPPHRTLTDSRRTPAALGSRNGGAA